MSKMLWACGYEVYKDILDLLPFHFKQKGYDLEIKEKYNKKGFLTEIYKSTKYDIIILGESMENTSFDVMTLENISQFMTDSIFIYIIKDTHKGTPYVRDLINAEIYNVLFQKDVSLDSIADLIDSPRKRLEAKIYLGCEDGIATEEEPQKPVEQKLLSNLANYLSSIATENRLNEFEHITQNLTLADVYELMRMLPFQVYKDIERHEIVKSVIDVYGPKVSKETVKKENYKDIVPDIHVITNEKIIATSLGSIVIAVGGTKEGAGSTNMAVNISKYLRRLEKKVALLEMNDKPVLNNLSIPGVDIYGQDYIGYRLDKPVNILNEISANEYGYIVLDLGCLYRYKHESQCSFNERTADKVEFYHEMNRSHISVLVHPAGVWNLKYLTPFMMDKDIQSDRWKVALIGRDKETETKLKDIEKHIYISPYTLDVGDVETIKYFEDMLKEIMSIRKPKKSLINKFSIFKKG